MAIRKKTPSIIVVAIITTITVFSWIFFEIYRVLKSKPPTNVPPEILEPFSPELNTESIQTLKEKLYFDEKILLESLPSASPSSNVSLHFVCASKGPNLKTQVLCPT